MMFNMSSTALAAFVAPFTLMALCACAAPSAGSSGMATGLALSGAQEVPAVVTNATGMGQITVAGDGAVSGTVITTGLAATMAHIHMAAAGVNGPVIVPLTKTGDNVWSVPAGAKLTDEQMKAYRAGGLYVNVHTDANKGAEIRTQLKP